MKERAFTLLDRARDGLNKHAPLEAMKFGMFAGAAEKIYGDAEATAEMLYHLSRAGLDWSLDGSLGYGDSRRYVEELYDGVVYMIDHWEELPVQIKDHYLGEFEKIGRLTLEGDHFGTSRVLGGIAVNVAGL